MLYAVWRACERFQLDPMKFDEFPLEKQKLLIGYNQLREHEEVELAYGPIKNLAKAMTK